MSEENKAVVRQFVEGLNRQDFSVFDEFVAPNFVDHTPVPGNEPTREGWKSQYTREDRSFRDLEFEITQLIAEGEFVVGMANTRGTHWKPFMGVAPTGKEIQTLNITIFRLSGGKIIGRWTEYDLAGLMTQLGMMPQA